MNKLNFMCVQNKSVFNLKDNRSDISVRRIADTIGVNPRSNQHPCLNTIQ